MEHTIYAIDAYENKDYYMENKKILENIPFISREFYQTSLFNEEYDVIVYSLLMDYTQEVYQHKNKNIKVTYGGYYDNLITDKQNAVNIYSCFDKLFFDWFSVEFEAIGQITPDDFFKNIQFIITHINKPIIFINGAEINPKESFEKDADIRHRELNLILDRIVRENDHVHLLDMRNIIKSEEDIEDNIRHYKRHIYNQLANMLIETIDTIFKQKSSKKRLSFAYGYLKHYISNKRAQVLNVFKK